MGEYAWVWGLGGFLLLLSGVYAGWVIRINKGESAAEAAKKAQDTADQVRIELAAFKEHVARDYATTSLITGVESRMIAAIERLGDRLDRLFEPAAAPRARSRSRATGD